MTGAGFLFDRWRLIALVLFATMGAPTLAVCAEAMAPEAQSMSEKPVITPRIGNHQGFGRVVLDLPQGVKSEVSETGDLVQVRLIGGQPAAGSRPGPHNVRSIRATPDGIALQIAPGTKLRRSMIGRRLVLDIFDAPTALPAKVTPPESSAKVQARPDAPRPDAPRPDAPRPASPPPPLSTAPAPAPVPAADVGQPAQLGLASSPPSIKRPEPAPPATPSPPPSLALAALAQPPQEAAPGHALFVPMSPQAGAAAFQRGAEAIIVFDERKPIDLQGLRDDAVFGNASIQLLPGATVLRLPLPPKTELRLSHQPQGWRITAMSADAPPPAITPLKPLLEQGLMSVPAASPGLVVSVPDPQTGGILLVGTQRLAGQGVSITRRTPELNILPSWQGVAIEPLSDGIFLRALAKGFQVGSDAGGRPLSATAMNAAALAVENATRLSRSFDFPDLPVEGLLRRLQSAVASASAAPSQGKAGLRLHVAEAMLSLGLAFEAQGVLGLAATGDARMADDPAQIGLQAIAALLAGRDAEAAGLDDPRLTGTDEIAFWRAVGLAQRHEMAPAAAAVFATTWPLLQSYPTPLRTRLLPLVAETLALGAQPEAAKTLLAAGKEDARLHLAAAFLHESGMGDPAEALTLYDRLAQSNDRLVRLRAGLHGAELRLAKGRATPAQTAETLGKMLYAWRGDEREINLRRRVAQLQSESGQPRAALKLLREAEQLWPDHQAPLRADLTSILLRALQPSSEAPVPAFDLITLVEENADLLPEGEAGLSLAERVGDGLIQLDLPARAVPVLERVLKLAPPGVARAAFGGQLAALRQQLGDPTGAIDALTGTVAPTLPLALLESRTMTFAAAMAAQSDMQSADRALDMLKTAPGEKLRGELKEAAKDWPGATAAWRAYANRVVPAEGALDDTQARILIRLASAASQAGDGPALAELRDHDARRLPAGQIKDLFDLLTSQSVKAPSDLNAITHDLLLFKAAPGAISSLIAANPKPALTQKQF